MRQWQSPLNGDIKASLFQLFSYWENLLFAVLSKTLKGKPVNRTYCNLYASLATYQTKRNNQHRCGFHLGDTTNRWSSAFPPQSNSCMQVRSSITAGEATYREKKLSYQPVSVKYTSNNLKKADSASKNAHTGYNKNIKLSPLENWQ